VTGVPASDRGGVLVLWMGSLFTQTHPGLARVGTHILLRRMATVIPIRETS
jgi:hypothetical protein